METKDTILHLLKIVLVATVTTFVVLILMYALQYAPQMLQQSSIGWTG